MTARRSALLASVVVGLATAAMVLTFQNADRAAATSNSSLSARPTAPPPGVTVDPTKEGVKAKATAKKKSRLDSSRKGKPRKKVTTAPRPQVTIPAALTRARKKDFRLNIGICGLPGPDGQRIGPGRCQPELPVDERPVEPTQSTDVEVVARRLPVPQDVTWEQVLSETKSVVFPGLQVKVQPAGRTLVNLETIVYTDQAKVSTDTVTLLGFPVDVEATPLSYTWNFGDGASVTTSSPGKPYPAKEIVHKYSKRGDVGVTLTTHYGARFNVAGTGWQYVEGTVPITGPATNLLVREAVPVLVDPPS
ncbi:hypothetical protein Kfla_0968 [Kribbella flavida DSM 17836]|uniref:PKD domain-containing protein n=1 Tax=Kribbella flavida (strain DSM 17836 / JCM 10339 / NBRC 14399) TaxID=479435 RepID=D2Q185_KRIFD|nr:PKD domain-containing protein [Kribbella flavida]ADB30073.1 hypothetical protein Kfla_0968 [Kribbella flavida DSM 17836]